MDENLFRQTLPGLSEEEKVGFVFQFLQEHLNKFAGLGMPVNAITVGIQRFLLARGASAPETQVELGKSLLLTAGTLIGYPAGRPTIHDEINPHIFLKILEYVANEWMRQKFDPKGLQEILEGIIGELKRPPLRPDLN